MLKRKFICLIAAASALTITQVHAQNAKPAELKIGITTFLSGSAAVFGVPAKHAADMYIEELNAAGGIGGVKLVPTYIDEGVGGDKMLSEYRRVVQEQGVRVMFGSVSSGSCNIVAPVAEDLKVLNIMWDCGVVRPLEENKFKYVVRTHSNSSAEMIASIMYLLRTKPHFKTIAVVAQDYAGERDAWELASLTLKALKPDVKVVVEMFPKFGATDFSTEISRLQAMRPDVVFSPMWGGPLDTFIRQASQRGLMKNSLFVLPLGESSLERLGKSLPDGVVIGARGDHWFMHPELKDDPKLKNFVQKFKAKTGQYPIYSVYHMVQGLDGLKAGYERAIKENKGQWPSVEQVADAMRVVEFRGLTRSVTMREDGQGLEDQLMGTTRMTSKFSFPLLDNMVIYPGRLITTPVGKKSTEWVKTIKPELMRDPGIKAFPSITE